MRPDELPRREAAKWLRQAAKDRNAAQVLIGAEPSRSVFHSQQAAEKAIKAFLTFHQIPFRKTHNPTEFSPANSVTARDCGLHRRRNHEAGHPARRHPAYHHPPLRTPRRPYRRRGDGRDRGPECG